MDQDLELGRTLELIQKERYEEAERKLDRFADSTSYFDLPYLVVLGELGIRNDSMSIIDRIRKGYEQSFVELPELVDLDLRWVGLYLILLSQFYYYIGSLETSLDLVQACFHNFDNDDIKEKVFAHIQIAVIYEHMGHNSLSTDNFVKAEKLLNSLSPIFHVGYSRLFMAIGTKEQANRNYKAAQENLLLSSEHAIKSGKIWFQIKPLLNMGNLRMRQGEHEDARHILQQVVILCQKHRINTQICNSIVITAASYFEEKSFAKLFDYLSEHLEIIYSQGTGMHQADTLMKMGYAKVMLGGLEEGIPYFDKAKPICKRINSSLLLMRVNNILGIVYRNLGHYDTALKYFEETREMASASNSNRKLIQAEFNIAKIEFARGNIEYARTRFEECLNFAEILELTFYKASITSYLADISLQRGNIKECLNLTTISLHYFLELDNSRNSIKAYINLANVHYKLEQYVESMDLLDTAYNLADTYKDTEWIAEILFRKILYGKDETSEKIESWLHRLKEAKEKLHLHRVDVLYKISKAIYKRRKSTYLELELIKDNFFKLLHDKIVDGEIRLIILYQIIEILLETFTDAEDETIDLQMEKVFREVLKFGYSEELVPIQLDVILYKFQVASHRNQYFEMDTMIQQAKELISEYKIDHYLTKFENYESYMYNRIAELQKNIRSKAINTNTQTYSDTVFSYLRSMLELIQKKEKVTSSEKGVIDPNEEIVL